MPRAFAPLFGSWRDDDRLLTYQGAKRYDDLPERCSLKEWRGRLVSLLLTACRCRILFLGSSRISWGSILRCQGFRACGRDQGFPFALDLRCRIPLCWFIHQVSVKNLFILISKNIKQGEAAKVSKRRSQNPLTMLADASPCLHLKLRSVLGEAQYEYLSRQKNSYEPVKVKAFMVHSCFVLFACVSGYGGRNSLSCTGSLSA